MDRYTGCMLGLAVGEALGGPVEGLKEGHIRQLVGEITGFLDAVAAFPDRPGKWRRKALYAAATQQALAIADTLAIHGAPDTAALADLYVRLADEGPADAPFGAHRAVDHVFRHAVQAMREARDARSCGQPSAGNAPAARIAPAALYYADDPESLGTAVLDFSLMTHEDPRAIAGALGIARAVALLAASDSGAAAALEIAQSLPGWVAEWESRLDKDRGGFLDPNGGRDRLHQFSSALKALPSLIRESNDALAAQTILNAANACGLGEHVAQAHAEPAPASVVMSLYRALTAHSFPSGILAAVNAGGHAGAVGAMVGALLGARFGEGAIPEEWIAELLNADQIRLRARAMREHEVDWSAWEDYVEMEKRLTWEERDVTGQALAENRARIEKENQRRAERKARAVKGASRQPAPQDLGFAPPPELWITSAPPAQRDAQDPVEAKKDKALRGRKRIAWKDGRREKEKRRKDEE